ncbi:MAG: Gfo/Idh/MocA family oxidoreductase [Lentisphaeria bacterium]|nr:Gfo/Idh/MocA family oxidoreductase [Lentisphaeria bacterium]
MKKFRIAAIGTGNMARCVHGPSWKRLAGESPDVELVCAVDRDAERAAAYARDFGYAESMTDAEEMLHRCRPDAVTIAVNTEANAALAAAVLRCGIPALCEKPPALNLAELETLLAAARRPDGSAVPHQVAYNRRYTPLVTRFGELRGAWEAESPFRFCRCDFYRDSRYDRDFSTTMVHGYDLVKFLLKAPYRRGSIARQPVLPDRPWVCNTMICAEMADGSACQLGFCPSAGVNLERYTMISEKRTVTLDLPCDAADGGGRLIVEAGSSAHREILTPPEHPDYAWRPFQSGFYQENLRFLEHLRGGSPFPNDFLDASDLVALMEHCRDGGSAFNFS